MIAKLCWKACLLVVLCFACVCGGAEVVTLGGGNFTDYVRSQRFVLVMFWAPWCSHSQTFAPQFDAIAATVDDPTVAFAKVDCVAEEGLYNAQKIEGLGGFPTLKAYVHGEVDDGGIHYTGERDRNEVLAFVQRYTAQSYLDLDGPDGAALVRPGTDATPLEAFIDRYVTRYGRGLDTSPSARRHGANVIPLPSLSPAQPGGRHFRRGVVRARAVAIVRSRGACRRHRHQPLRPRLQARRHGCVRDGEESRDAEYARGDLPELPGRGAGADAGGGGE